jgi:hypothetical protein
MNKYFFDVVSQHRSEYDYQGCALDAPEEALRLAELVALDLEVESDGGRAGWSVAVRDAQGRQYFSIPVQCTDLVAA